MVFWTSDRHLQRQIKRLEKELGHDEIYETIWVRNWFHDAVFLPIGILCENKTLGEYGKPYQNQLEPQAKTLLEYLKEAE